MPIHPSLLDHLDAIVREFTGKTRGVRGIVIADPNGLALASMLPEGFDASHLAAVGTLLAQSAESAFDTMRFTFPEMIVIEGSQASIVCVGLPGGLASIVAILEAKANLGLVKVEMKRTAVQVALAIGGGTPPPPRISELFILYRGGVLIRHYSDTMRSESDRDILGGMLEAVQTFMKQVLATKKGNLEEMKYGNNSICFVQGTHATAAFLLVEGDPDDARYSVFDALEDFEERYHEVLQDWKGSLHEFPEIDECFRKVLRPGLATD